MASRVFKDIDVTIPSAGQNSNVVDFTGVNGYAKELHVVAPAALTGTVVLNVSYDGGVTFIPLQSQGTDVEIPQGKVTVVQAACAWDQLRLESGSAEAADRDFILRLVQDQRL